MAAKNFKFKTIKPTGKWGFLDKPSHEIKLNGIYVGSIDNDLPHKIRFKVNKDDVHEDGIPNCKWKWITLKKDSESLDAAKQFLIDNFSVITTKFKIVTE